MPKKTKAKKAPRRESLAEVQTKVSRALEAAGIGYAVKSMQAYWVDGQQRFSKRYVGNEPPPVFLVGVFVHAKEKN